MISNYTDYRRFLRDRFGRGDARKFATALNMAASQVSNILTLRRHLRPEQVDATADFLELSAPDRLYLSALVDLHNPSPRAQRTAWATVQARLQQRRAEQADEVVASAFARWHVVAIYGLAGCESFRPDASWIARALQPQISEEDAEEALQLLISIGLLEPDEESGLRRVAPGLWSDPVLAPGPQSEAGAKLHKEEMKLGRAALEQFRHNERHFSSAMFAIPEDRYDGLVARLRELEQEIVHAAITPDDEPSNRVYWLGVQLFPVSLFTDSVDIED